MQNKRICKHLIEEILHIQIETLTFIELEKTIDIYHNSHGIRLDVTAHDEHHTRYNIEMQASDVINENTGLSVLPKRTRYYQAMLDMDLLKKGQPYDRLNPTYIIFICNFDLFGKELYSYTFQKQCQEDTSLTLPDDTTVLFLNASGTHGSVNARVCQEFCVNFLEIFVIFFHQWAQPFIDEQLVPDHCPIGQAV